MSPLQTGGRSAKRRLFTQHKNYSTEFKEQALRKAHDRGSKTLQNIADDVNIKLCTLKNWLKQSGKERHMAMPKYTPANNWTAAQRLAALNESHGLKDQALHAWCPPESHKFDTISPKFRLF